MDEVLQLVLILSIPFLFVILCGKIISYVSRRNGEGTVYVCPNCGNHFISPEHFLRPGPPSGVNMIMRYTTNYKVLKCPHCGIRDMCRRVIDDD